MTNAKNQIISISITKYQSIAILIEKYKNIAINIALSIAILVANTGLILDQRYVKHLKYKNSKLARNAFTHLAIDTKVDKIKKQNKTITKFKRNDCQSRLTPSKRGCISLKINPSFKQ